MWGTHRQSSDPIRLLNFFKMLGKKKRNEVVVASLRYYLEILEEKIHHKPQ
jgi:hypothetical protein